MGLLKEFKEFAIKGNIVDLAVAVVIGGAFTKIVTALVANIIMPLLGSFVGNKFELLVVTINKVPIKYGLFLEATVDFFIVAFLLFLFIKGLNRLNRKKEVIKEIKPTPSELLLIEIRDLLKK